MAYQIRIERDSINTHGDRLTTWVLTYPRFVHAELMTHRLFSRNSSSSRAIPTAKLIEQVMTDPVMPVWWGKNQAGMQAREELSDQPVRALNGGAILHYVPKAAAQRTWLHARDEAVKHVQELLRIGLHKQIANRILEPWMWITVIVSATEFENWFWQRDHKDAQPEIAVVASEMYKLYKVNEPALLKPGAWHLPFTTLADHSDEVVLSSGTYRTDMLRKISTGRCARVSYLTHEGKRDPYEDVGLHDRLASTHDSGDPGHYSPFEHPAMALDKSERWGNFVGWKQYRKFFDHEHRGRDIESLQRSAQ